MSRPSSGQFTPGVSTSTGGHSGSHSGTSSNRDSVGMFMPDILSHPILLELVLISYFWCIGTTSEDDGAPPPLPLKVRDVDVSLEMVDQRTDPDAEADYCNLSATPEHVRRVPSTPSLRAKVTRQQTTVYQPIWILPCMQGPVDFFDTLKSAL